MTEILAVFRSRSQAIDCMNKMRAFGIPAQLINTPKEAGVGCGLSLKFSKQFDKKAKNVIARMNYSSFYGYLNIETHGGKIFIRGF